MNNTNHQSRSSSRGEVIDVNCDRGRGQIDFVLRHFTDEYDKHVDATFIVGYLSQQLTSSETRLTFLQPSEPRFIPSNTQLPLTPTAW